MIHSAGSDSARYHGFLRRFAVLTVLSVIVRAVSVVFLVPLLGLFDGDHDKALVWLGALTASTIVGWIIDRMTWRAGF